MINSFSNGLNNDAYKGPHRCYSDFVIIMEFIFNINYKVFSIVLSFSSPLLLYLENSVENISQTKVTCLFYSLITNTFYSENFQKSKTFVILDGPIGKPREMLKLAKDYTNGKFYEFICSVACKVRAKLRWLLKVCPQCSCPSTHISMA